MEVFSNLLLGLSVAITPVNLSINVGASVFSEPDLDIGDVPDLGLQAYGRLTYYLRP